MVVKPRGSTRVRHLAAQEGLLAREAHLDHVVVVLQEALQLVAHRLHARAQALVPRLDPPHPLQVLCDDLQGRAQASALLGSSEHPKTLMMGHWYRLYPNS